MQNIKEAFGGNLRKIRKSKNLTIEKLSELIEITPRQLSKIESGETFFTAETLSKISITLNVTLQALFDFEWHDDLIYYDENKYIRHHFKVSCKDNFTVVKSLPALPHFKINQVVPRDQIASFLMDFSKNNNMTIYVEFFVDNKREQVFKVTPNGGVLRLSIDTQINQAEDNIKDKNYYFVMEKLKEFSADKKKTNYLRTAIEALSNKRALEKLKAMIEGIEISKQKN